MVLVYYNCSWQNQACQDEQNWHQDCTIDAKCSYGHDGTEESRQKCDGSRNRGHEHRSSSSPQSKRQALLIILFDPFELSALIPRIEKHKEIVCCDTQNNKDGKVTEYVEVSHADDVLADQARRAEGEGNNEHTNEGQEERLQMNYEPEHHKCDGNVQIIGVILRNSFELLVPQFT